MYKRKFGTLLMVHIKKILYLRIEKIYVVILKQCSNKNIALQDIHSQYYLFYLYLTDPISFTMTAM